MDLYGVFRDGHPHLALELPGNSQAVTVDFIVDTGFYGDLTLSSDMIWRLDAIAAGTRLRRLADGSISEVLVYEIVLENDPLMGTEFLVGYQLEIALTEGGEVSANPL